jgi:hypothetical protein
MSISQPLPIHSSRAAQAGDRVGVQEEQPGAWAARLKQFPEGTMVAMVRRAFAVDTAAKVRVAAYKRHELSDAAAHDLLVQVLDARVLPVTKLPVALTEWRTPRHPEFREGKTAWRLFNAVTEAAKGGDIQNLPRRTQALHGLMDAACHLTSLAV